MSQSSQIKFGIKLQLGKKQPNSLKNTIIFKIQSIEHAQNFFNFQIGASRHFQIVTEPNLSRGRSWVVVARSCNFCVFNIIEFNFSERSMRNGL